MNPIIVDILRRWKWRYLTAWLMIVMVDLGALRSSGQSTVVNTFFFAPWLGGCLVLLDLVSGTAPLLLRLPMAARKIGLAYWLVGVCFPPLALVLAEVIARLAGSAFSLSFTTGWEQLGVTFVVGFLLAGISFYAITLLPAVVNGVSTSARTLSSIWFQMYVGLLAFVWLASMVSGLFVLQFLRWIRADIPLLLLFCGLGLALTILGYVRSATMIQRRSRPRAVGSAAASNEPIFFKSRASWLHTGITSLFIWNIPLALQMACFGVAFGFILPFLKNNPMYLYFCGFFVSLIAAIRYSLSLRVLRILPISTARLELTLFFLPLVTGITFGLLVAATRVFFVKQAPALTAETLPVYTLVIGTACLCAALTLRFGLKAMGFLFPPLTVVGSVFAYIATRHTLPTWVYPGLGFMCLVASYIVIRRTLNANATYRVKSEDVVTI